MFVVADVADGCLVSQHPYRDVERILNKEVNWKQENRIDSGSYYQADYVAAISLEDYRAIQLALYNQELDDNLVWLRD